MRGRRWIDKGVLERVFAELQRAELQRAELEAQLEQAEPDRPLRMSIDSTSVKVHQEGTGAPTERGRQAIGRSRSLSPGLTGERSDDQVARYRAGRSPPTDYDPDAGPLGRCDARAGCRTRLGVSHAAKVESPQALGA